MCPETRLWSQESLERFNTKTSSEFEARLIAEAGCRLRPSAGSPPGRPRLEAGPQRPACPGATRPAPPGCPRAWEQSARTRKQAGPRPLCEKTERPPSHRKDSSPRLRAASGGAEATHRHFCPPQVRAEGCEGRARNRPRQSRWKTTLPRSLGLGPQHTTAMGGGGGGYGTPGFSPPWVGEVVLKKKKI